MRPELTEQLSQAPGRKSVTQLEIEPWLLSKCIFSIRPSLIWTGLWEKERFPVAKSLLCSLMLSQNGNSCLFTKASRSQSCSVLSVLKYGWLRQPSPQGICSPCLWTWRLGDQRRLSRLPKEPKSWNDLEAVREAIIWQSCQINLCEHYLKASLQRQPYLLRWKPLSLSCNGRAIFTLPFLCVVQHPGKGQEFLNTLQWGFALKHTDVFFSSV